MDANRKMQTLKNKSKISTSTIVMLLIFSTILASLPLAISQTPETKQTFALIDCSPNPVGINQKVLIVVGITDYLTETDLGWENLTVEITKPDGTTDILGPIRTDATGMTSEVYIPDAVGTYTLQSHFPEQTVPAEIPGIGIPLGTMMLASSSETLELIVQDEPVEYYPGAALPNEYWTRPINSQFREWSSISGNWLYDRSNTPNKFAPNNDYAPETPHILWTKSIDMGGLAGGTMGEHSFENGEAYEGKFDNSVIIGGVLYYNRYSSGLFGNMESQNGIYAVDLHTGEELWFRNNTRLGFGQLLYWDSYNMHGVFAYLWEVQGSTWNAYDPSTGEWMYSFENVPTHNVPEDSWYGAQYIYGSNGEILRYTLNLTSGWMTLWNSSRVITSSPFYFAGSWGMNAHTQTTFDATAGIEWNVTIPTELPGSGWLVLEDRIIGSNTKDVFYGSQQPNPVFWAISTAPGHEGELLWNVTWSLPIDDLWVHFPGGFVPNLEDRVFLVAGKETRQYWGFSIDTGERIWGPTDPLPSLTSFSILFPNWNVYGQGLCAYGKLVVGGMGGVVAAYDIKTGKQLWTYELTDTYQENLFGNYWPAIPAFITDGKVYVAHTEHSPINPLPRDAPLICLDIESGEEIFRVDGLIQVPFWGSKLIIGDSIIATCNIYDNRIYAIGKGASATTVKAPDTIQSLGTPILIKGTVMDVSPGTEDTALQLRFPNGVPAVSDESMGEWMKHVYMQFEKPEDTTGVEVVFNWIDSNGTWHDVGRTTSDASGFYSYVWTPPAEGKYTIVATFVGSEGYYGSSAETALIVGAAEEEAPSAEEIAQTTVNKMPAYPVIQEMPAFLTIDLIIMVIAVVGVVIGLVAYMALRKQK